MIYVYRVEIETDKETGEIVASIPTLNYTADFGGTVEEAIERLRELAVGFVETLIEEGEPIPPSDKLTGNDHFTSVHVHGNKDIPPSLLHKIVVHQAGLKIEDSNKL